MLISKDISERDKIILNSLGENADIPLSTLAVLTQYKRKTSVYNRIKNLKKEKYLFGPYFSLNYNAIGKNNLFLVFVFLDYNPLYKDVVLKAMKKINCWTMIFPVRTAETYLGVYRCNNWNYLASLFNLMKQWGWLKDYTVHKSENRWIIQNPDFFGDLIPSPGYKIPEGDSPHYQYEEVIDEIEITKTDIIILKYLSRKTCRLTEIRDLEFYYYKEKLKYYDLKRSYEKLKQTKILLKKIYSIFPLPVDMCSLFFLFTRGSNFTSHLKTIANFGKDLRLTKKFIVVGNEVVSYFMVYPLLEGKILGILEDYAVDANIYGIETYPTSKLSIQSFNDNHFDVEKQRWTFPHSRFREEIKKLKEKEQERT